MILEAIKYQIDKINKLPLEKSNFLSRKYVYFFYRTPNCIGRNQIQEVLERLVIAHKVVTAYSGKEIKNKVPDAFNLLILVDEEKVIQGSEAILAHLDLRSIGISSQGMIVPVETVSQFKNTGVAAAFRLRNIVNSHIRETQANACGYQNMYCNTVL